MGPGHGLRPRRLAAGGHHARGAVPRPARPAAEGNDLRARTADLPHVSLQSRGTNRWRIVPSAMRRWCVFIALGFAGAGRATAADVPALGAGAGGPPLLLDALGLVARNFDRWAYTETRIVTDEHGVPKAESVLRFDPSKPYAEQYRPLKIEGRPPTERQLKDYRRRGEKRGEKFAKQE